MLFNLIDYLTNLIKFYGQLSVGTPEQVFNIMFDTGSSNFWLPSVQCTSEACNNKNLFNSSISSSFKEFDEDYLIEYGLGKVSGKICSETLTLGGEKFENVGFGLIDMIDESPFEFANIDGILGLSFASLSSYNNLLPPFYNILNQINLNQMFSIWLNNNKQSAIGGELTLGGINYSLLEGINNENGITWSNITTKNYWQIKLNGLELSNSYSSVSANIENVEFIIDSGSSLLILPTQVYNNFTQTIPLGACNNDLCEIDCSINFDSLPTLNFLISSKSFSILPKDYIIELEGNKCVLGVIGQDLDRPWGQIGVIGSVFLRRFVTVFDLELNRVGFGKAVELS